MAVRERRRRSFACGTVLAAAALVVAACTNEEPSSEPSLATESGTPYELPEPYSSPEREVADDPVDTEPFTSDPPWRVGVSAGYLSNSWVSFALAHVRHAVRADDRFVPQIELLNASGVAEQQSADIDELVSAGVDGIVYWSAGDEEIEDALLRARAAGVPTVSVGSGIAAGAGTVASAYVDQYELGVASALGLVERIGGEGRITAMLPIEGTVAAVNQARALDDMLAQHPDVDLVATAHGDWNRDKARTIAEEWVDTVPDVDGVFSPAGQMSVGIAEALAAAGLLGEVELSPADEFNGWLRWIATYPEVNAGLITFPPAAGAVGVEVLAEVLTGADSVTRGERVASIYHAPADAADLYDESAPDDWWANDLPDDLLPDT